MSEPVDEPLLAKVLTVSDGVFHGFRDDTGGRGLAAHLIANGYEVIEHRVTEDGAEAVADALRDMSEGFAGLIVTTVPLVLGILGGKYLFRMKPPIVLGACAGARTTTAALGAIEAEARSSVPALGYTVTYAVGNTLLTIWGVVVVLLMT